LLWDIEEMQRRWFSSEPDTALFMTRDGQRPARAESRPPVRLPRKADRPGRLVLWRAASDAAEKRFAASAPTTSGCSRAGTPPG
jgi:hypothetical protein